MPLAIYLVEINNYKMATGNGLRQIISDAAGKVGNVARSAYDAISSTPITKVVMPMNPFADTVVKTIAPRLYSKVPTVGAISNEIANSTIRPGLRLGFEGAQTITGDNRVYTPSTPLQKFVLGERPLRNLMSEDRDTRRFARWAGIPKAGNAIQLGASVLDALALPSVIAMFSSGGVKKAADVGLRSVADSGDDLTRAITHYRALADNGDDAARSTANQLQALLEYRNGASPEQFAQDIARFQSLADKGDDAARATVEQLKAVMGTAKSSLRTAADSRPLHQIAFENAVNSGDWGVAKKIVQGIPDGDPYKSSMKSLYETLAGATDWSMVEAPKVAVANVGRDAAIATKAVSDIAKSAVNDIPDLLPEIKEQLQLFPRMSYSVKDFPGLTTVYDGGGNVISRSFEPVSVKLRQVGNISKKKYNELGQLVKSIPPEAMQLVNTIEKSVKDNTVTPLVAGAQKDISALAAGQNTLYRNFKTVFGNNFDDAKRILLDPFDAAKGRWIENQKEWLTSLNNNIVNGLGIKKGSKLSQLTQLFGEKKLSIEELQKLTPDWQKVVDADSYFRNAYNQLLDEVNAVRAQIYPNNLEKIIPKREDYYRHFQEMAEGFGGLKNIFDTPANIPSSLSGISEFVKPKSRFLSFAQKREGDKTTVDAVGGFLNYIKSATYAKYVDPQVGRFRALAEDLAKATESGVNKNGLNNFIEYLHDFANDLSGKTNAIDRGLQKWIPGGRKAFQALDWVNSRYKANAVLGNMSSSLNQILNIPAGIADSGIKNYVAGSMDEMMSMFRSAESPIAKSAFIKERYFDSAYDKFNSGMFSKAKDLAKWVLTVGDEIGTKTTWYAQYNKALGEGLTDTNAIKFADDATRNIVGGRGVGEVPLFQKSKLTQFIAPFQLEVANQWYVMKGWMDEKSFGKFITFFLANNLLNSGLEQLTGNRPAFDPITALMDGVKAFQEDEDKFRGSLKLGGRLSGEILGNMPYVQSIISQFDELPLIDTGLTKQEIFGRQDPTRYGGGVPLVKALTEPQYFLVPPFGGAQLKKSIQGLGASVAGGAFDNKGNLRYPVGQDLGDKLRLLFFGKYAAPESQMFYNENMQPFTSAETGLWKMRVKAGNDPVEVWARMYQMKAQMLLDSKIAKLYGDASLTPQQRAVEESTLRNQFEDLSSKLESMAGDYHLPKTNPGGSPSNPNLAGAVVRKKSGRKAKLKTPQLKITSRNSSGSRAMSVPSLKFKAPNITTLLAKADKELQLK